MRLVRKFLKGAHYFRAKTGHELQNRRLLTIEPLAGTNLL